MPWLITILFTYVLGGLTFVPLVILSLWYFAPYVANDSDSLEQFTQELNEEEARKRGEPPGFKSFKAGEILEKEQSDVKAYFEGWIIVTREHYQFPQVDPELFKNYSNDNEISSAAGNGSNNSNNTSSFMKMFTKRNNNNNNNGNSSDGGDNGSGKDEDESTDPATLDTKQLRQVRKKNRFFGVLKHGNLFLYSDEEKKDVQHVIVLSHYLVALWPRNTRDGSLFSKKSSICLYYKNNSADPKSSQFILDQLLRSGSEDTTVVPPPGSYFVHTDLNHQREDWYFSLIRATSHPYIKTGTKKDLLEASIMAKPMHFKTADMIELIQTINSTEGQLSTKWFNAFVGRIFLGLYQTEEFKFFIKKKVEMRLNKIKTPGFLDDILITHIDVGHSAPFLTNPKFQSLNTEGETKIELNLLYQGGLSITLATKLFVFKREMDITLKIKLLKLHGDVVFLIKPPPSNRLWYSFSKMPEMKLDIQPVVSSRSMNYNVVTKIIQNKFEDAIKESLVLPFMDDFVLYPTDGEIFRGDCFKFRCSFSVRLKK
ncbi:unnamed protein product [Ambrosiozyma monospora]|uniref:Unnamed protein product n=1 Tax=Ambrosiozyma monospora TaxID=43982 RepID=A0ACB5SWB8_AMBMO|nr:unnamed protein product [Ambrosiozyma monospora]